MEDEVKLQNWTSLDLYYKGFHIKKSISENITPEMLIKKIEGYLEAGFMPSWNNDTNKSLNTPQKSLQEVTEVCQHPTDMVKVMQVKKDGPNQGKWFKNCGNCKSFLGWTTI